MLKFFAKCFESVCCILAVLNFIVLGSLGGYLGYYIGDKILHENPTIYAILISVAGIAIAFFINVLSFGLIAQITEIRRNLEFLPSINSKLQNICEAVTDNKKEPAITENKNTIENKPHNPKLEAICKSIPGIEL